MKFSKLREDSRRAARLFGLLTFSSPQQETKLRLRGGFPVESQGVFGNSYPKVTETLRVSVRSPQHRPPNRLSPVRGSFFSALMTHCASQGNPFRRGEGKCRGFAILRVTDLRTTFDPARFYAVTAVGAVGAGCPFRVHEARPSRSSRDSVAGRADASAVVTAASNRG